MKIKYTDDQVIIAVRESISYHDVGKKIGYVQCYKHIKDKIIELRLDVSHFNRNKILDICDIVSNSFSYVDVLRALNMKPTGGNYLKLKKRIKELKLNIAHFTGSAHSRGKTFLFRPKRLLEDVLVEHSTFVSSNLKKRLIKEGIIENKCYVCGINTWRNKELNCQLDHINGIHDDNRIDNLRMLCPNCHSQTETYCRGPKVIRAKQHIHLNKIKIYKKTFCSDCKIEVKSSKTGYCVKCKNKHIKHTQNSKIEWPQQEMLKTLIWEKPIYLLSKELGVSDSAIIKHCRKLNIDTPARGYWTKIKYGKL